MFVPAYASKVFLSMMTVAPCRQTGGPATYRLKDRQRIRQVSGWEAVSDLKGGLFLAEIGLQLAGRIGRHGLAKHLFQVFPRELEIALGHGDVGVSPRFLDIVNIARAVIFPESKSMAETVQ